MWSCRDPFGCQQLIYLFILIPDALWWFCIFSRVCVCACAHLILCERCSLSLRFQCVLIHLSALQVHVLRGQSVGLPVEHQRSHMQWHGRCGGCPHHQATPGLSVRPSSSHIFFLDICIFVTTKLNYQCVHEQKMAATFRLSSEKQNNNNKDKMDPSPPSVPPSHLPSSSVLPVFPPSFPSHPAYPTTQLWQGWSSNVVLSNHTSQEHYKKKLIKLKKVITLNKVKWNWCISKNKIK